MSSEVEQPRPDGADPRFPRAMLLLLGGAGGVIILAGMRAASSVVGPTFLALILTIAVYPAQTFVLRHGWPRWSAFVVGALGAYAIFFTIAVSIMLALARFASLLPEYDDEAADRLQSMSNQLAHLGIDGSQQQALADAFDPSRLADLLSDVLGSVAALSSSAFFILTVLFFMAIDAPHFPDRLETAAYGRRRPIAALTNFARTTRIYLVVSTVFGLIVALIDTVVLAALGIPAPLAWGVLAFVTNYVPNIGFVLGLAPPAFLALLEGGPSLMLAVVAAYSVINFVIQSLIQPKFVADAVGLSGTITVVSLLFWAWALGPLGAFMAVPLSLLVKAVLVDADERAAWLTPLISPKSSGASEP